MKILIGVDIISKEDINSKLILPGPATMFRSGMEVIHVDVQGAPHAADRD